MADSDSDDEVMNFTKQGLEILARKRAQDQAASARPARSNLDTTRTHATSRPNEIQQSSTFTAINPDRPVHIKQEDQNADGSSFTPAVADHGHAADVPFLQDDSDVEEGYEQSVASPASAADSVTSTGKKRQAPPPKGQSQRPRKVSKSATSSESRDSPDPLQEEKSRSSRQSRPAKPNNRPLQTNVANNQRNGTGNKSPATPIGTAGRLEALDLNHVPGQGPDWYSKLKKLSLIHI